MPVDESSKLSTSALDLEMQRWAEIKQYNEQEFEAMDGQLNSVKYCKDGNRMTNFLHKKIKIKLLLILNNLNAETDPDCHCVLYCGQYWPIQPSNMNIQEIYIVPCSETCELFANYQVFANTTSQD